MADSRDVRLGRARVCVLGGVLSALVGGCGLAARADRPEPVLAAYAKALGEGDAARAYALLTSGDRGAVDARTFREALAANRREAQELAERLRRSPRPRVLALVALDDGSEIALERGPAGFRVVDPLTRFYEQSSPRAALLSFIRAVERERWDVVVRLMPDAEREGSDLDRVREQLAAQREELTRLAALLSGARDAPIEIVGDRATMPYAESFTARFVREHGLWKLEDPD